MEEYRYENKIPMQISHFSEFWHYLHQLGLFGRKSFPDRRIHSVYLDDANFQDYLDNVAGISQRRKMRLRWYDDNLKSVTIEAKTKNNKASTKPSLHLDNPNELGPFTKEAIANLLRENDIKGAYSSIQTLHPILEVDYKREYFLLAQDIRMTVDKNIIYRQLYPTVQRHIEKSPVDVVVEFKYSLEQKQVVQTLLAGLPFRLFRHSKYAIGIDSVYS